MYCCSRCLRKRFGLPLCFCFLEIESSIRVGYCRAIWYCFAVLFLVFPSWSCYFVFHFVLCQFAPLAPPTVASLYWRKSRTPQEHQYARAMKPFFRRNPPKSNFDFVFFFNLFFVQLFFLRRLYSCLVLFTFIVVFLIFFFFTSTFRGEEPKKIKIKKLTVSSQDNNFCSVSSIVTTQR